MEPAQRSAAWPYLTREPVSAVSLVCAQAAGQVTKEEIVAVTVERFGVSPSSAKSLVDAVGGLGLYEYVSKSEIGLTPLGREWQESASPINLVRLLHLKYFGVGEILAVLEDEPLLTGEINARFSDRFGMAARQGRTAGILRALASAGAVGQVGHARYVSTALGRALLAELPVQEPPAEGNVADPESLDERQQQFQTDLLIAELDAASRDSSNPSRFERACAEVFKALGVEATHLGGAGRTDVLVTVKSSLGVLVRAIVDAKSTAGQLSENAVKFDALKDHAARHGASAMAVVAPGFEGSGRLADWARANGVVLFTAGDLGRLLREHDTYPYSAADVAALFTVDGADAVRERRRSAAWRLDLISSVMKELVAEAALPAAEPIAARDIGRVLRRSGEDVTDEEVAEVLRVLAQPDIRAVHTSDNKTYTLPSSPQVAARRLLALARAIAVES